MHKAPPVQSGAGVITAPTYTHQNLGYKKNTCRSGVKSLIFSAPNSGLFRTNSLKNCKELGRIGNLGEHNLLLFEVKY